MSCTGDEMKSHWFETIIQSVFLFKIKMSYNMSAHHIFYFLQQDNACKKRRQDCTSYLDSLISNS